MNTRLVGLFAATALFVLGLGWAEAQAKTRVYFLRGFMDVSTGLDQLAARLSQRGISSVVANHGHWSKFATDAIRRYNRRKLCRIVIVGHSLGADASIAMAAKLREAKVPVSLIVTFGPFQSKVVPPNVRRVVNYYRSNSYWNNVYSRGRKSRTRIRNVDLASKKSIDHFNIERVPRLHAATMRAIRGSSYRCRR